MYANDVVVDAHQHVWDLSRASYPWLGPALAPINRTMELSEVEADLRRHGVDATILVQSADCDEDTDYMLDVAAAHPEVCAVVAYLPLDRPSEAAARLESLGSRPLIRGVRTLNHLQPDPDWLLRPEVGEGLSVLAEQDLAFDVVAASPRFLRHVAELAAQHPDLRIVIDHLGTPPLRQTDWEPWRRLMSMAAECPNVYAKISGLYPSPGDRLDWSWFDLAPFIEFSLELFGARRLMFGGDWPISVMYGGYAKVWAELLRVFETFDADDRHWILGQTALDFYGVRLPSAAAVPESTG